MKSDFLPSSPLTINWALTNRCTFYCSHCYSREDPDEELSFEELCRGMKHAADSGVLSVNFGGGEPLLRKDLLDISEYASKLGMRVSMNSNGYLLTGEKALELKKRGFSKVGISIDSHLPEVHDTFRGVKGSHERAVKALSSLNDAGIETSISTVICRINHSHIEELTDFARKNGAKQLNFHNFKCSGLGYSNKDKLDLSSQEWGLFYKKALEIRERTEDMDISLDDPIIALLGKTTNGAMVKGSICGKLSLNIKTNGDITPCGFIPIVIGNITRDNLKDLWKDSPVLKKMRHKTPTGKCEGCGHYEDCLGGCSARALALTGDINNPDPHCWKNGS